MFGSHQKQQHKTVDQDSIETENIVVNILFLDEDKKPDLKLELKTQLMWEALTLNV